MITHGGYAKTSDSITKILQSRWSAMLKRCEPGRARYVKRYAHRGIFVCAAWKRFDLFKLWALRSGFAPNLTLERIDNDLGYFPSNCVWATLKQQANNRVTTKPVRCMETGREFSSGAVASEEFGLNRNAVRLGIVRDHKVAGLTWEYVC